MRMPMKVLTNASLFRLPACIRSNMCDADGTAGGTTPRCNSLTCNCNRTTYTFFPAFLSFPLPLPPSSLFPIHPRLPPGFPWSPTISRRLRSFRLHPLPQVENNPVPKTHIYIFQIPWSQAIQSASRLGSAPKFLPRPSEQTLQSYHVPVRWPTTFTLRQRAPQTHCCHLLLHISRNTCPPEIRNTCLPEIRNVEWCRSDTFQSFLPHSKDMMTLPRDQNLPSFIDLVNSLRDSDVPSTAPRSGPAGQHSLRSPSANLPFPPTLARPNESAEGFPSETNNFSLISAPASTLDCASQATASTPACTSCPASAPSRASGPDSTSASAPHYGADLISGATPTSKTTPSSDSPNHASRAPLSIPGRPTASADPVTSTEYFSGHVSHSKAPNLPGSQISGSSSPHSGRPIPDKIAPILQTVLSSSPMPTALPGNAATMPSQSRLLVLADEKDSAKETPSEPPRKAEEAALPKKKYPCQICQRSFTTLGHLARHNRTHTGERNHECPFETCNARFARQDNCMQHYKTHLDAKSRPRRGRPALKNGEGKRQ